MARRQSRLRGRLPDLLHINALHGALLAVLAAPVHVGWVLPADSPCTDLAPFDLTTGGTPLLFHGHKNIKEFSAYVQDAITKGNWTFNVGLRADVYRGFVNHTEPQPRLGIAYNIKRTNTVLRVSYARTLETPFNETLILASTGCQVPAIAALSYNFLSTFSGTHYVTPRTETVELGFHF